jgi:hypothetical protein
MTERFPKSRSPFEIISSLGGSDIVGKALGKHAATIVKWYRKTIPEQYWDDLIKLDRRRNRKRADWSTLGVMELHASNSIQRTAAKAGRVPRRNATPPREKGFYYGRP